MLIAVASKGRAGNTTTNKVLPNLATWFVPKSEYHQYKGLYKNIEAVPNEVRGITATRNWILKNTSDKWVVMLDDDVKAAGYIRLDERKAKHIKIRDERFWADEFLRAFDITEQLNYKIWGVKTESARRSYYPYKPILLKSYVTASCMGIVNNGEFYFDEDFEVKEDYEICLRHLTKYGGIYAIRYLYWENDHWEKEGGCKDYRTIEVERDAIKRLIKKYPGMVRGAKRKANEFTIQLNL